MADFVTRCRHFIHQKCSFKRYRHCPVCDMKISYSQTEEICQSLEPWTDEDLRTLFPFSLLETAVLACQESRFYKQISFKFIINSLKQDRFDVNQPACDQSHRSLVRIAYENKNYSAVKELVHLGIDLKNVTSASYPINAAFRTNDLEFFKLLINCKVNVLSHARLYPGVTLWSLDQDDPVVFNETVRLGFNPKNPILLEYAASNRHYNSVIKLIGAYKFDVNHESRPLQSAIDADDTKMIELLIQKGANINTPNSYGYSPFQYACSKRQFKAAKLLYELLKPDLNVLDPENLTPLVHFITTGSLKKVEYFIERGADVNQVVLSGSVPLSFAFIYNSRDIVNRLISLGCSLNTIPAGAKRLPIHDIIKSWYPSYLSDMMSLGADSNAKDIDGNTALHYACKDSKMNFIKPLVLNYGADFNALNNQGQRPIDLTEKEEILNFLLENGSEPKTIKESTESAKFSNFCCVS